MFENTHVDRISPRKIREPLSLIDSVQINTLKAFSKHDQKYTDELSHINKTYDGKNVLPISDSNKIYRSGLRRKFSRELRQHSTRPAYDTATEQLNTKKRIHLQCVR